MASPFSGSAGRKAAIDAEAYMDSIWRDQNSRIKAGRTSSLKALDSGYKGARQDYTRASERYQPYADTGLKALSGLSDATGVNGQEGHDRAVAAFRAGPGYDWQVDQATDAVARKASSLGVLGSGNTMAAITDRASHLADQEYDDYLDRLSGLTELGYSATGAQAGIDQDMGNLNAQKGRDKADVYGTYTGMAVNSRADTADRIASARTGGFMAGQNAAANRWNAGMSLAQLAAGFAGGDGFKNLKSMFA